MLSWQYPTAEEIAFVTAIQTDFLTAELHLVKALVPLLPGMVTADLSAQEADFSGYAAITLATMPDPFVDGVLGGVSFSMPTRQFNTASPTTIPNDIYGGWLETTGGLLIVAFMFPSSFPMQVPFSSLGLELLWNFFGTGDVLASINGQPQ
jgi:hypothetical protein